MLAQNLQYCRHGNGQYHSRHAEERAADEQGYDDYDGVQADDGTHDLRHDEMAVYLLYYDVKDEHLDCQRQIDSGPQQNSRHGSSAGKGGGRV